MIAAHQAIPSAAEFVRLVNESSNTRWIGDRLTWLKKPRQIRVEFGENDSDTGEYAGKTYTYSRIEAARLLRDMRASGMYIEKHSNGSYYLEANV